MSGHRAQGAGPADPPTAAGAPGSRDGLRVPPLTRLQGEDVRHPHVDPGQLLASDRLFVDLLKIDIYLAFFFFQECWPAFCPCARTSWTPHLCGNTELITIASPLIGSNCRPEDVTHLHQSERDIW